MNRPSLSDLPRRYQEQASRQIHDNRCLGACSFVEHPAKDDAFQAPPPEETHSGRYIVRVVAHRVRLCDEDNLAEKYHVDALRYAGVIPDDDPATTHIEVSQVKVAHRKEEKTVIEITTP